jgi:hypothetical protein
VNLDKSIAPLEMTCEELKMAGGSSWRILDRLSVVAKSGRR